MYSDHIQYKKLLLIDRSTRQRITKDTHKFQDHDFAYMIFKIFNFVFCIRSFKLSITGFNKLRKRGHFNFWGYVYWTVSTSQLPAITFQFFIRFFYDWVCILSHWPIRVSMWQSHFLNYYGFLKIFFKSLPNHVYACIYIDMHIWVQVSMEARGIGSPWSWI